MSLPRSPYRSYLGAFHRPILALLRGCGCHRLADKWIRISNRNYAWPLPGILSGVVLQLGAREDFQYLEAEYEPRVCGAIQRLVKPGFICADVGAHIGYMTLLMAKLVGDRGRVFAFEASPENAELLRRNVEHNGWSKRIEVENRAVTDHSHDSFTLYRGPSSFEASVVANQAADRFTVPSTTLDDYFPFKVQLDFVKMDIEGAEAQAMVGMIRILGRTRPTILLEVHDAGWPAVDQLTAANYLLRDLELRPLDAATMRAQRINHCVAVPPERAGTLA